MIRHEITESKTDSEFERKGLKMPHGQKNMIRLPVYQGFDLFLIWPEDMIVSFCFTLNLNNSS